MNKLAPYFLILIFCTACQTEKSKRFELTHVNATGIAFENTLIYTEEFNPYTYRNFYNGAGVALGDINNDGLLDIYFTGNIVNNKLFLNKGNWQFEDITANAGVACKDIWSTGATFVDINADGYLDLYVCKSGKPGGERRYNELFINQGDNTFIEKAKEYGLAVEGLSVHAAFLDYRIGAVHISAKGKEIIKKMAKGEKVLFENSGLSKREWNELMSSFEFNEKIV